MKPVQATGSTHPKPASELKFGARMIFGWTPGFYAHSSLALLKWMAGFKAEAGHLQLQPEEVNARNQPGVRQHEGPTSLSSTRRVIATVRAKFAYQVSYPDDCTFEKGDTINVFVIKDHNWWHGENARTGREGQFPCILVTITKGVAGLGAVARLRAVYDFKAQEKGDLAVRAGDTVLVTELLDDNWWKGRIAGSKGPEGVFPRSSGIVLQSPTRRPGIGLPKGEFEARCHVDYRGNLYVGLLFETGDRLLIYMQLNSLLSWGVNLESNYQGVFLHSYVQSYGEPDWAGIIQARATFGYNGFDGADLAFEKGDIILVKHIFDNEVAWARNNRTGCEGLFPEPLIGEVLPADHNALKAPVVGFHYSTSSLPGFTPESGSGSLSNPKPRPAAVTPPTENAQVPILKLPTRSVLECRLDTDLVRDSKLDATFTDDVVCHTSYTFHPRNRHHRILVEEKWKAERYLGRGGFGQVDLQKCVQGSKEGQLRAVKKIVKKPYDDENKKINYDRELEAIAKFSHEKYVHCFARSFGWYENEEAIFITMEYFEHEDLQKHMRGRFPEFEVGQITVQILEGLNYMHDNGFAHRDLKPANILVKERSPNWWVKISDFGISKRASGDHAALRTLVGTPRYLAPEVIRIFAPDDTEDLDSDGMAYTVAVDQWALGAIAFQLLASRDPFPHPRSLLTYVHGKEPFPSGILTALRISEPCIEFLKALLAPIPSRRPNASSALKHPWIEEITQSSQLVDQSVTLIEEEFSLLQFDTATASLGWTEALQKP
ncbi:unnamed protein product [Clonostachys rosea]|uniref:mitogen-activated protein kinase kinase n=1 Tax=Bionectria ochroleuca TaxID=29856 RepID=A0ABY6UZR9_BIOOC|nr:unnamed protein product [Clonostachys rosea]